MTTKRGSFPEVTLCVPVYRNAGTLRELHRRVCQVLGSGPPSFEILFVNDSSPDDSLAVLEDLSETDDRVAVLCLGRNVGQHQAVLTGLRYSQGRVIVVMDADLQDPPEAIPRLLEELRKGYDAVFAGRRGRYESTQRLLTSRLFKRLLHVLTGLPGDAGLFVAMTRSMRERLLAFQTSQPSLLAMMGCTGLPTTSVPVEREVRTTGRSAYTSWTRLTVGLRAVACVLSHKHLPPSRRNTDERNILVKSFVGNRFTCDERVERINEAEDDVIKTPQPV